MIDRKFLDELYRKLGVIQAERKKSAAINNFSADDCSSEVHRAKADSLLSQESMVNEIIDDYLAQG